VEMPNKGEARGLSKLATSHHSPSIHPPTDGLDSTRELRAMHKAGIMKGELGFDWRRDLLLNTLDVGSPGWAPIIGVSANVRAGQVAKVSRLEIRSDFVRRSSSYPVCILDDGG
jgi:hypothetical protein